VTGWTEWLSAASSLRRGPLPGLAASPRYLPARAAPASDICASGRKESNAMQSGRPGHRYLDLV